MRVVVSDLGEVGGLAEAIRAQLIRDVEGMPDQQTLGTCHDGLTTLSRMPHMLAMAERLIGGRMMALRGSPRKFSMIFSRTLTVFGHRSGARPAPTLAPPSLWAMLQHPSGY
jgi:hypothetical protein